MAAHTSDGKSRPNIRAVTLPPIPSSISESGRVGLLADLGNALLADGGTISPLDHSAAYSQNDVTKNINALIIAANAMGANPPMKTYVSIDYNSFVSIMHVVAAGMATIPGVVEPP